MTACRNVLQPVLHPAKSINRGLCPRNHSYLLVPKGTQNHPHVAFAGTPLGCAKTGAFAGLRANRPRFLTLRLLGVLFPLQAIMRNYSTERAQNRIKSDKAVLSRPKTRLLAGQVIARHHRCRGNLIGSRNLTTLQADSHAHFRSLGMTSPTRFLSGKKKGLQNAGPFLRHPPD